MGLGNGHEERGRAEALRRPVTPAKVLGISLALVLLLVLSSAGSLLIGTASISPAHLWGSLTGSLDLESSQDLILFRVRLPRIILAGLVGYALSLGGVVFQAILRNPLADPFVLGVSSGAAFGAILGILFGFSFHLGVPLAAFLGALLAITVVLLLATRKMGTESATILLTGVIVNAFFTAVIMFFVSTATDSRLHTMLFWLYGDLSQSRYSFMAFLGPGVLGIGLVLYGLSKHLNLITAGEDTARMLGVDVCRTKRIALIITSILIALAVSFSGLIGFVGLVVPHLARMSLGSDHRILIPAASLGGAIFLIAADTLARVVISPSELPVGVVTAFLGAPFFLVLLSKGGSGWNRS
ncbi:MAG: iron ABC transporter permease [Desulfobacteraceae bacterium]|nr:MAG: iron ABC transporter permease [Desulfobacteraceae bacterium]